MKSRTCMLTIALCLFAALAIPVGFAQRDQPAEPATEAASSAPTPAYTLLYPFTGDADGGVPDLIGSGPGLIRDRDGNLYGTTFYGGNFTGARCNSVGCGVVFKLDRAGNESVVYAFTGAPDGRNPTVGMIRDDEGNLYGTVSAGGTSPADAGAVFKIDRAGNESLVYSFAGQPDGADPAAGVIRDRDGTLYGTTALGGTSNSCTEVGGCGTIFKIDRTGKETILHSFTGNLTNGPDGAYPGANLVRDDEGNLYGTAGAGGAYGDGVIFKVDHAGNETVLYSFTGGADGVGPSGLVRAEDGTMYGVAEGGSGDCTGGGCGVVFKLDKQGKPITIYTFPASTAGWHPNGPLVLFKGDLYGTTTFGGATCSYCGAVFKLDRAGNETVLYSFSSSLSDGIYPNGGLVVGPEGNLYGTTQYGGDLASPAAESDYGGFGCGVVFKLTLHEDRK